MAGALGAVDHLDRPRLEAGAVAQGQQALPQRALRQGGELVEQGEDELGIEDEHQQLEPEEQGEAPEPPRGAHPAHQREQRPQQREPQQEHQHQTLQLVRHPQLRGRLVEAEPLLEPELLPPLEGQRGDGQEHAREQHKQRVVPRGVRPAPHRRLIEQQGEDPAEQGERQHQGIEHLRQHAEARPGQGVVHRPAVGVRVHRRGHGRRGARGVPTHLRAVQGGQREGGGEAQGQQAEGDPEDGNHPPTRSDHAGVASRKMI